MAYRIKGITVEIDGDTTKLQTAQDQANTALTNGTISQAQYDAIQREIIETENELRRLEEQADSSAAAVRKIGAAGSDLEALREKAGEMGANTKFSALEAAEATNYMAMAGWKTGDMLSGNEGIMNLAAASGEDLAATSDIVTDALTAFVLSASDSGHFADILADCRLAFSGLSESEQAAAAESLVGKNAMSGFLALMNAGELLMPAIRAIVGWIQQFVDWLNGMDEGPLHEYESWMPDFMAGLARGIDKSRGLVENAVGGPAADMVSALWPLMAR